MNGDFWPNPRVRLDIAYAGAGFRGWQIQPDRRTVQGELTTILTRILERPCQPVGAGRTDTGVHARGQVAHVELNNAVEVARVCGAMPRITWDDLQVLRARPVSPAFDARFSATARRYAYRLKFRRNIFDTYAFHAPWRLDRAAMDTACRLILGTHDFASFCKTGSQKEDNTCDVDLCALEWTDEGGIFHIRANRFLHHMVRNLVGLLIEVGRSSRRADDVAAILAARDRRTAGKMAPACGLFLEEVNYPEELADPSWLPPDFIPRPEPVAEPDRQGDDA